MNKLSVLVVAGLVILLLGGCEQSANTSAKTDIIRPPNYKDLSVHEYDYNGMPCLIVTGGHRFGITCDWSKWDQ